MIKLKNILSEQDNTIDKKEWKKVSTTIYDGMDTLFFKGVKYLRDYDRSNLPPKEKRMLTDFFNDFSALQRRFGKIEREIERYTKWLN